MAIRTLQQLLLDIEKRLKTQEQRQTVDYSSQISDATEIFTGRVDPNWSSGKPNVILDANQSQSGPVSAFLPPNNADIQPGCSVLLSQVGGGAWIIETAYAARTTFMRQVPIPIVSPGYVYSDVASFDSSQVYGDTSLHLSGTNAAGPGTPATAQNGPIWATVTTTGVVSVCGMMYYSTAQSNGAIIAGPLPPNMRPARTQTFNALTSGAYGVIAVTPDGYIRARSTGTGYLSLNNIRFRSAASVANGSATFVDLTSSLVAPFVTYSGAALCTGDSAGAAAHTPGYTIDADGLVLFEGHVYTPSATAANATILNTNLQTQLGDYMGAWSTTGANDFLRFGAAAGAGGLGNLINSGPAQSATATLSLSPLMTISNSPGTINFVNPGYLSSWGSYGAGWQIPSVARTPDGLVLTRGLASSGTVGSPLGLLSRGYRPRFQTIFYTISNATLGRIDMGNVSASNLPAQQYAMLVPATGSNAWFTLGGLSWPAWQ